MPILRPPTPEELQQFAAQGVDVDKLPPKLEFPDTPNDQMGKAAAVGHALVGRAGGIAGGGLGAVGLGALAGSELGPPGMIAGGIVGGLAGGYGGQKVQQEIENPNTYAQQQELAAQAEKEHPYVTGGAEIAASALASGGSFSPSTLGRGIRGLVSRAPEDVAALQNVALQTGINTGVNTAVNYATGQPLSDNLASSALGGALFAKPAEWATRLNSRPSMEPTPEPINKENPEDTATSDAAKPSPWMDKTDDGQQKLDDTAVKTAFAKLNPKPDISGMSPEDAYAAQTAWRRNTKISTDDMRQQLHDKYVADADKEPEQVIPPLKLADDPANAAFLKAEQQRVEHDRRVEDFGKAKEELQEQHEANPPDVAAKPPSVLDSVERPKTQVGPTSSVLPLSKLQTLQTGKKQLGNDVNRPEVRPTTPIEGAEPTATSQHTLGDQRTPEEQLQDRMEGSNARYSQPTIPDKPPLYADLIQQQKDLLAQGKAFTPEGNLTPEYKAIWKRVEQEKNKNKGMPPKQSAQSMPYGFWTTPEGHHIPVDFENHRQIAQNLLKRQGINEPKDTAGNRLELEKGYVRSVYDRAKNRLMVEAETKNMTNAQRRALKNLGIEKGINVSVYPNRGYSRTEDLHTIDESIKSSATSQGQTTPQDIVDHIWGGKATTGSVMGKLASHTDHPFAPLAKWLYENMDSKSRNVPWEANLKDMQPGSKARNQYHPPKPFGKIDEGKILGYTDDNVEMLSGGLHNLPVVMEEALHSMTSAKLPKEWNGLRGSELHEAMTDYLKNGKDESIKELIKSYIQTAQHLGIHDKLFQSSPFEPRPNGQGHTSGVAGSPDIASEVGLPYAMGDLHEFIAHAFSDYNFQTTLDRIPSGIGNKSMWQRIVDAVSRLLGFPVNQRGMLDRVLRNAGELIRTPREGEAGNQSLKSQFSKDSWLDRDAKLHEGNEHYQIAKEVLKDRTLAETDAYTKMFESGHLRIKESVDEIYFHGPEITDKQLKFLKDRAIEKQKALIQDYPGRGLKVIYDPHPELHPKYAIQEPSTGGILPRKQSQAREARSERSRMGQRNEGEETARKSQATNPGQSENDEVTGHESKGLALTKSAIDKVAALPHSGARAVADGLKLALNEQDRLLGHFKNATITAGKGLTPSDLSRINEIKNAEMSTGKVAPQLVSASNSRVRKYYDTVKRLMSEAADYAIKNKIPITVGGSHRLMVKDPSHWAGMANQKVEQIYRDNTDRKTIEEYDKKFDQWNQKKLGLSKDESQERIQNWKKAIQGDSNSSDLSHQGWFNAIRKAQGDALPPEFREQNPVTNDSRYFDRFASSASHYKYIESNPEIMSSLGATKDAWGRELPQHPDQSLANNATVKGALDTFVHKNELPSERNEDTLSSLVTSAFIAGPPLEVHKLISNFVKATSFADNPYQLVRAVGHALTNLKEGYQHSVEGNVAKLTTSSASDMWSGTTNNAEKMRGLARLVRQVSTLGDLTTNLNAGFQQAFFESMIPSKIQRANAGNREQQIFLKNLDPSYTRGKQYDDAGMQQLASLAAKYVHGTGDIRSLPAWMSRDGEVSGFFQLAHWSVAQTNNFMKDVWSPALRGNYTPLIMSVFGSVAGGYIIKELRTEMQGRPSPIPSLSEIASSDKGLKGNGGLLMYNAIAAMQYSGFGGLLSQLAKYPFDFVYKNTPQGATFPLDEVASDVLGTMKQVSTAIANDPNLNWGDMASQVALNVLSNNFQMSRMAINQGINSGLVTGLPAEKKILRDKMQQLRRFDMAEGLPYAEQDAAGNPYMNIEQHKFKSEQDIGKAVQMLPQLVGNIMETYHAQPDVMMQKLKALKENQYATMPSMEDMPLSFMKYVGYLQRMEGPEQAQQELQDYMKHKITNEAKASAVP